MLANVNVNAACLCLMQTSWNVPKNPFKCNRLQKTCSPQMFAEFERTSALQRVNIILAKTVHVECLAQIL